MAIAVTYQLTETKTEFTTNTFTVGNQLLPDALGLSGGGFVVAYNNSSATSGYELVDFYDANYDVIGSYRIPYESNDSASGQPRLTELSNGNVLVVWDNNHPGNAGVQGAIFQADGTVVATGLDLVGGDINNAAVDVAALSTGDFVLSYEFNGNVYARRYNAEGVEQQSIAVDSGVGAQTDTHVTQLAGGGFVVTWTDENANDLIRGRIYNDSGTAQTAAFTIGALGDNTKAEVAALPNGNFVVVYQDTGWSPDGLTMQIHTPAGANVTPDDYVRIDTGEVAGVIDPAVTVLDSGHIVVTWTSPFGTGDNDIHGRIFSQIGYPLMIEGSSNEFTLTNSGSDDLASAVSALLNGQFITSWQDSATNDGSGGQITSVINELTRTVIGDDAADSYSGDELRDSIDGGGGGDTLEGFEGDDSIFGGSGVDDLDGGLGNDLLEGGLEGDFIEGGFGEDRIYAATAENIAGSAIGDTLLGGFGDDKIYGSSGGDSIGGQAENDRLRGAAGDDTVDGGNGADDILGAAGEDLLQGGAEADTVNGGKGADLIFAAGQADPNGSSTGDLLIGGKGADSMFGSAGLDTLEGGGGGDLLAGGAGADTLLGGAAKDTLEGGDGADSLVGGGGEDRFFSGLGADTLTGGSKGDVFVFDLDASSASQTDLITDLTSLDRIDFSAIDAKESKAGNQAFTIVEAFTGNEGELVLAYDAGEDRTVIFGDTDGDMLGDFFLYVSGDRDHFTNFAL